MEAAQALALVESVPAIVPDRKRESFLRSELGFQTWSVYVLRDPDTRELRYIGCSRLWFERQSVHRRGERHPKSPVDVWKKRLASRGKTAEMQIVFQCFSREVALRMERDLIMVLGALRGPRLLNRVNHPMFWTFGKSATRRTLFNRDCWPADLLHSIWKPKADLARAISRKRAEEKRRASGVPVRKKKIRVEI